MSYARPRWSIRFTLAASIAMAIQLTADAASFTPYRLLDPEPDYRIYIRAASPDGRSLVGLRTAPDGRYEAIRWSEAGGLERLGPLSANHPYTEATRSSFDGTRVVGRAFGWTTYDQAFVWDEATGIRGLESRSETDYYKSQVTNMTPDGSTLVGSRAIDRIYIPGTDLDIGYEHAFRWTEAEGLVPLFRSSGPESTSRAIDVSDDGSTIVGSIDSLRDTPEGLEHVTNGFIWRADGSHQLLEGLGGDEASFTRPIAISGDGSTVIGRTYSESTGTVLFVWTSDRGMRPLAFESGADAPAYDARDVSFDGSLVVGSMAPRSSGSTAFVWDADRGVLRLEDYLESLGVDLGGLSLLSADSVLADGRTIFGFAYDRDTRVVIPYLAVIPEPGPAVLIGLGLMGMRAAQRRPRRRR